LTLVSTVSYVYYNDRKQAKAIRQEYIDKVKGLALEPLQGSLDEVRKVKVVAARWPGDDEPDRSLLYFKKYVKVNSELGGPAGGLAGSRRSIVDADTP
jgi:import inner membrane translocase subunit TIM54